MGSFTLSYFKILRNFKICVMTLLFEIMRLHVAVVYPHSTERFGHNHVIITKKQENFGR